MKTGDLVRVPKKMHIYCMYFNVYERIWCRILSVYCTYTRILYVYARIDEPSNFPYRKYVHIRVYVHIRTKYDALACTYNILRLYETIYWHI